MDEALREVLLADDRIAYALLFGSMVRGDTTPFSDVDVAIGLQSGVGVERRCTRGVLAGFYASKSSKRVSARKS
jgi:predicted nucleotidyltransferase